MRIMINVLLACACFVVVPLATLFVVGMYQTLHTWGLV